jgi:hypothetical protein
MGSCSMSNDHAYRWHAQTAYANAERAITPKDKVAWKLMARAWNLLAADEPSASPETKPVGPEDIR